jgi:hypothetical protein
MDSLLPRIHIATILKFTAICGCILALFRWSGVDLSMGADWPESIVYPLGVAMLCALSFMRPAFIVRRCEACGRKCPPRWRAEPSGLCPTCRVAKLPPKERRRVEMTGLVLITVLFVTLPFVLLWPFAGLLRVGLGEFAYPAIAIGLFAVLFAVYCGVMVLRHLFGVWRMSNPRHALEVARSCAGEAGREAKFGKLSVHMFGPTDPAVMLKTQVETSRLRFEALVGEPLYTQRPLRVFAFGKRSAFETFFRRVYLSGSNLDGTYIAWSTPTIALTTDYPTYRLADPERVARILAGYFHLECFKKCPTPFWLQVGIANRLACGSDEEEHGRLNRRLLASVSKGTALGTADLMNVRPEALVRVLRDWQEPANFVRYMQFSGQARSVVEYLAGEGAPGDRRERFRGFLADLGPKTPHQDVYRHHFDHGYDSLLEQWRAWVCAQGAVCYGSPPPHVGFALLDAVIPVVRDRNAPVIERIQAIREMGRAGYVLGADTLLELLGSRNPIPREEIVWTLESISGLALGDDRSKWAQWWHSLSDVSTCLSWT